LILFRILSYHAGMKSNRIFIVCAILSLLGTGVLLWRLRKLIADPILRRPSNETLEADASREGQ